MHRRPCATPRTMSGCAPRVARPWSGITAYAAEELGDIVFVELPEIGRTLTKDETLGVIESVKTASDLFAPVAGEVIAVNEALGRRARAGQQRALRGRLDGPPARLEDPGGG